MDNNSTLMTNSAGEMGSPYLRSFSDLENPCLCLLSIREYQLPEIYLQIKSTKTFEKPILFIILHKYGHATLSYAMTISIFITTLPPS